MTPLLVLRVGYMERYDGPASITGGGAYVAANGVGGEVFNFKPSRGRCYGYAMSRHGAALNLKFIDGSRTWKVGDELAGVDVVFIARKPGVGQVVVGWYRGATVFHRQYRSRRGRIPGMQETKRNYLCMADAANATLLPGDQRTFEVPYAPTGKKGFPGQSNVWYPLHHASEQSVSAFVKQLRQYIHTTTLGLPLGGDEDEPPTTPRKGGQGYKPDQAHNAAVEVAAVQAAFAHYKAAGYAVESVESDNLGWDLFATKAKKTLRVEVKGVSGSSIYFELTPNEYKKLQEHAPTYRVCVVCEAITDPRLYELVPEKSDAGWRLMSKAHEIHVPLMERIAAIGAEVANDGGAA